MVGVTARSMSLRLLEIVRHLSEEYPVNIVSIVRVILTVICVPNSDIL
jgi:hypothetical protein